MKTNRPLYNPVFTPSNAVKAKEEIVASRIESDPWYAFNMGRLMLNRQLGRVAQHVYENVAARLVQIARRNAL